MDNNEAANSSSPAPLVLGIDGGGTKTQAWLAKLSSDGTPQVIGRGLAGSSNRIAVGVETALANLEAAMAQAFTDAKLPEAPIANAVLAIAGSGTSEVQQQLVDFVKLKLRVETARVVHDGQAVLEAGTPDGWGIALIVGTGAVAYGKNPVGVNSVVGGWGFWFGDEESAFWLGQAGLRAISQADDGRASNTALRPAVLSKLQVGEPREILLALSHQDEVRRGIADLAPLVCEVAAQRDPVAYGILTQAAVHWSDHILCLEERLALDRQFPLAIAGGVLCGSAIARELLLSQLAAKQVSPSPIQFIDTPVSGCVALAAADWHASRGS